MDIFKSKKQKEQAQQLIKAAQLGDSAEVSQLLGVSPATLLTLRCRAPERLPPSWRSRPLRWRRKTVLKWIEDQETIERRRCELKGRPERSGPLDL